MTEVVSTVQLVVAIDPGGSSSHASGIAVWLVSGPSSGPSPGLIAYLAEKISRAGYTQEMSINLLDNLIGDAEWIGCAERSPPVKSGKREAASFAYRWWLDVFGLLARRRFERAKQRGLASRWRVPIVLRPRPQEWRAPLGLPTRGVGKDELARRAYLKAKAVERIKLVHGIELDQVDAAEAANMAEWAGRLVARGIIPPRFFGGRTKDAEAVRWAA